MEPVEKTVWQQAAPSGLGRLYWLAVYAVGAACMGGIVILTGLQVFYRYAVGSALFWPEEAARALLIAITFLLAGASYHRGEMAAVESVAAAFGATAARIFKAVSLLLVLALLGCLIWYGYIFAEFNAGQIAAAMQISVFWIYLLIPVGLFALAVHVAIGLVTVLRPPGEDNSR